VSRRPGVPAAVIARDGPEAWHTGPRVVAAALAASEALAASSPAEADVYARCAARQGSSRRTSLDRMRRKLADAGSAGHINPAWEAPG